MCVFLRFKLHWSSKAVSPASVVPANQFRYKAYSAFTPFVAENPVLLSPVRISEAPFPRWKIDVRISAFQAAVINYGNIPGERRAC